MLQNRAFTLLVLVMALAIFGILAGIAIPNWAAQLPTYRLNSAVRQVQSELHRIRSQAVAGNKDFRVVFVTPALYRIEKNMGSGYEPTGESRALPDGIAYGNASVGLISFTPRGTSNGGTIRLCNNKREGKSIVVLSSTGRIRVVSGAC